MLAIALAFLFGYSLTMLPLLRAGLAFAPAASGARLRHALDRGHGLVDNAILLFVPGAMEAGLDTRPLLGLARRRSSSPASVRTRSTVPHRPPRQGHAVVHAYHGH